MDAADRPRILIAVPNTGHIHTRLAQRLLELAQNQEYQVHFFFPFPPQIPHDNARNFIAKVFLEYAEKHQFEYLLTIDSDVIPPKDILDMAKNKLPICSAVCFVFNGDEIVPTASREQLIDGKRIKPVGVKISSEPTDVIPVDFVGGGCVMFSRKALEDIKAKGTIPYAFDYDKDGLMWQGEDYHFCEVARAAGIPIHVDRRYICGHYKDVDLYWLNGLLQKYWKEGGHHTTTDGNRDDHGATDAHEDPGTPGGATGQ